MKKKKRTNTFYGYPIDCSSLLSAVVYLAPDRDLKRGTPYPIGAGGYGIANADYKAGEIGAFTIEGNFIHFSKKDDPVFIPGEIDGFDLQTGDLKKRDTPGTLPFYRIDEVFPYSEEFKSGMITGMFIQPGHP